MTIKLLTIIPNITGTIIFFQFRKYPGFSFLITRNKYRLKKTGMVAIHFIEAPSQVSGANNVIITAPKSETVNDAFTPKRKKAMIQVTATKSIHIPHWADW